MRTCNSCRKSCKSTNSITYCKDYDYGPPKGIHDGLTPSDVKRIKESYGFIEKVIWFGRWTELVSLIGKERSDVVRLHWGSFREVTPEDRKNWSATISDNWAHKTSMMTCGTCMCFSRKGAGKVGRCRRHAPVANLGWPVVFESDWCYDHKLDETRIN